jgi:hypothetical protein
VDRELTETVREGGETKLTFSGILHILFLYGCEDKGSGRKCLSSRHLFISIEKIGCGKWPNHCADFPFYGMSEYNTLLYNSQGEISKTPYALVSFPALLVLCYLPVRRRMHLSFDNKLCNAQQYIFQPSAPPSFDRILFRHFSAIHHGLMTALASQTSSLLSQLTLAHHPSDPNKHQSTPVTNSVCRFSLPISRGVPAIVPDMLPVPSVHTLHVIS